MRQSDILLEKYWVTQSGYFRLAATVALGMGITDGKLLYCHGVAEGNKDKKISTLEYNNRTLMTDSIIHLHLIVVAQLCIYLPSPSMIDPPV